MQTPEQVLDAYFLDSRCMLLELAATLDRFDRATEHAPSPVEPGDLRLEKLYQSLTILADRGTSTDRAERLLNLFSDPV